MHGHKVRRILEVLRMMEATPYKHDKERIRPPLLEWPDGKDSTGHLGWPKNGLEEAGKRRSPHA